MTVVKMARIGVVIMASTFVITSVRAHMNKQTTPLKDAPYTWGLHPNPNDNNTRSSDFYKDTDLWGIHIPKDIGFSIPKDTYYTALNITTAKFQCTRFPDGRVRLLCTANCGNIPLDHMDFSKGPIEITCPNCCPQEKL